MPLLVQVILFISTDEKAIHSKKCLKVVQNHAIPLDIVRLDTEADRKRALHGKGIKIEDVPTLVLIYEDGDYQTFLTSGKIIQTMLQVKKAMESNRDMSNGTHELNSENGKHQAKESYNYSQKQRRIIEDDLEPNPPFKNGRRIIEEDITEDVAGDDTETIIPMADPEQDEVIIKKSKKAAKAKIAKTKAKSKKKIKNSEPSEEVEIEFVDDERPKRPPPPPTKGLMVGPQGKTNKASMKNVMSDAKQMQREFEKMVGKE